MLLSPVLEVGLKKNMLYQNQGKIKTGEADCTM